LSYPVFLLVSTFGVLTFMLKFVVPMFMQMFKQFDHELPFATRLVVKLSNVFSDYLLIGLLLITGVIAFLYSQRKQLWYKRASAYFIMSVPFLGNILSKMYVARFCQSMHLLL